jgi:hypothetical protein
MLKKVNALFATVVALAIAVPAFAQAPQNVRMRGTVDAVNGDTVSITTREGLKVDLKMQPNWTVESVIAVKPEEIKAGDFVGASAIKRADGKMVAEAIHYLDFIAPANRDAARRDIPWDLTPQSLMINADTGTVVKASDGTMTLKMTHSQATYDLIITPTTPIVKYRPGEKSLLVKGAWVFLTAQKQPDNSYTATLIRAETNGVKPPL